MDNDVDDVVVWREDIRKFQGDYESSFYCILLPEWWKVIDWNVEMQHTVEVPDYTSF